MFGRWAPAFFRLHHDRRSHTVSAWLIVLVIALTAGVAMAAVAGARRSDLAYRRFLGWAHNPELTFSGCTCDEQQLDEEFDRIRAAPFTLDSARGGFAQVVVELEDGTQPSFLALLPVVAVDDRFGRELPRTKMLHGRLPHPNAPDEASISFLAAERFGLDVGDRIELVANEDGTTPIETAHIVGIHAAPGEFPSAAGPQDATLLLSRAFARAHSDIVRPVDDALLVRLQPGTRQEDVDAFVATLRYGLDWDESAQLTRGIERTVAVETIALLALALVVCAAGIVVTGQMLRRAADLDSVDGLALAALGWARGDSLRLAFVRGCVLGGLGAAAAGFGAFMLSPLFPVGIGRIADPDVGWHVDWVVLFVGMGATVACVAALALVSAAGAGAARNAAGAGAFPGVRVLRGGRRPATMVGLAFSRPGRQRGAGTRVSILSLVAVTALLAATLLTVASFDHLARHRELAGATWDAAVLPPEDADGNADVAAALALVRRVSGVDAATTGGWASSGWPYDGRLIVDGTPVEGQVFGDDGAITPAIRRGRAPARPGEIALGAEVMHRLGLHVGDDVVIGAQPDGPTIPGRVVGESVLASPYFVSFEPGAGGATVASTFAALGEPSMYFSRLLLVRYERDAEPLRTFNAVEAALGTVEAFETADRAGSTGLDRARTVPIVLVGALLALVAAAMTHVLLVSVRQRRRDLAVLSAIGFSGRQARVAVTVHGALVALVVCAIGIPLGVIAGLLAWGWIAEEFLVVSRPTLPVLQLGALTAVLVVLAIGAALLPASRAARSHPATVLREH